VPLPFGLDALLSRAARLAERSPTRVGVVRHRADHPFDGARSLA